MKLKISGNNSFVKQFLNSNINFIRGPNKLFNSTVILFNSAGRKRAHSQQYSIRDQLQLFAQLISKSRLHTTNPYRFELIIKVSFVERVNALTVDDHALWAFAVVLLEAFELDFEDEVFPVGCDDCLWVCSIIWWISSSCCFVRPSLLPPLALWNKISYFYGEVLHFEGFAKRTLYFHPKEKKWWGVKHSL